MEMNQRQELERSFRETVENAEQMINSSYIFHSHVDRIKSESKRKVLITLQNKLEGLLTEAAKKEHGLAEIKSNSSDIDIKKKQSEVVKAKIQNTNREIAETEAVVFKDSPYLTDLKESFLREIV